VVNTHRSVNRFATAIILLTVDTFATLFHFEQMVLVPCALLPQLTQRKPSGCFFANRDSDVSHF
jgi:hypothetical protein